MSDLYDALRQVPDEWRGKGFISWPGYNNGVLTNIFRVTLHHSTSSGGGPRVTGFGATWETAMNKAVEQIPNLETGDIV